MLYYILCRAFHRIEQYLPSLINKIQLNFLAVSLSQCSYKIRPRKIEWQIAILANKKFWFFCCNFNREKPRQNVTQVAPTTACEGLRLSIYWVSCIMTRVIIVLARIVRVRVIFVTGSEIVCPFAEIRVRLENS